MGGDLLLLIEEERLAEERAEWEAAEEAERTSAIASQRRYRDETRAALAEVRKKVDLAHELALDPDLAITGGEGSGCAVDRSRANAVRLFDVIDDGLSSGEEERIAEEAAEYRERDPIERIRKMDGLLPSGVEARLAIAEAREKVSSTFRAALEIYARTDGEYTIIDRGLAHANRIFDVIASELQWVFDPFEMEEPVVSPHVQREEYDDHGAF